MTRCGLATLAGASCKGRLRHVIWGGAGQAAGVPEWGRLANPVGTTILVFGDPYLGPRAATLWVPSRQRTLACRAIELVRAELYPLGTRIEWACSACALLGLSRRTGAGQRRGAGAVRPLTPLGFVGQRSADLAGVADQPALPPSTAWGPCALCRSPVMVYRPLLLTTPTATRGRQDDCRRAAGANSPSLAHSLVFQRS